MQSSGVAGLEKKVRMSVANKEKRKACPKTALESMQFTVCKERLKKERGGCTVLISGEFGKSLPVEVVVWRASHTLLRDPAALS